MENTRPRQSSFPTSPRILTPPLRTMSKEPFLCAFSPTPTSIPPPLPSKDAEPFTSPNPEPSNGPSSHPSVYIHSLRTEWKSHEVLDNYSPASVPPIALADKDCVQLSQESLNRAHAAADGKADATLKTGLRKNKKGEPLTADEEFVRKMKRRKWCLIAVIILGLLLAIVVPVGWFFWPRFPEIRVLNLNLAEDNGGAYHDNLNYLEARIRLNMLVSIYNPNAYDLELQRLDINANLNCNRSELEKGRPPSSFDLEQYIGAAPRNEDPTYTPSFDPSIGTGTRGGGLTFPSRVNLTFALNFTVFYTPTLLQVCGITRPVPRPARISYDAVSTVKSLSRLGYYPRVSNSVFIRCPASDEQIAGVVDAVNGEGNRTVYEILESVFRS
ncbi:hypothetical protein BC829DRAFT_407514 [Chytridium lagenaria]|nr:hypothetical protein BC829DRAFT_407514 [Chytridium lagenaria]